MTSMTEPVGVKDAADTAPVTLVTSDGERLEFGCAPGRSVLEAAAEAGMALPASCRRGTCGSCAATVTDGAYELGSHSPAALPEEQRKNGGTLLCRTSPRGPLSVALPYPGSRILYGGIPVRESTVTALETVARDTVRLELRLTEEAGLDCQFEAGQFMELQAPGTETTRAYSPANTGNWEGRMEFFIRLRPGGVFSTYLRDRARPGDRITVRGPQGAFGLQETGLRPRWFVAGGTGLAPVLSMLRHMAEWQEPQRARLFFGVNEPEDVFGTAEIEAVAAELPGFTYDLCVWRRAPGGVSATPVDLVSERLAAGEEDPDLYLCGPPPMVDAVVRAATAAGVPAERIFRERFLPG